MLLDDLKQLKTGRRELRNFGLLVGGVFLLLGLWALYRHKPWYPWLLFPGGVLLAGGALVPAALKPVYIAWMTLALVLGFVMSHVILTLFFFLVITPVGIIARISGKDFLRLKLDPGAKSYWMPRPPRDTGTKSLERQF